MWPLIKYARFVGSTTSEWEYFDNSNSPLELIIGDSGHLIVNHGSNIMESYNLTIAQRFLRGQCKGDSMIIFCHMQDVSHRFRVKFSETETKKSDEACRECAEHLAKYFPIKTIAVNKELNGQQPEPADEIIIKGEITLSDMCNVLTDKEKKNQLPKIYRNMTSPSAEDIDICLRLCLSDPCFPAFVEQVELELNRLKSDSNL